MTRPKDWAPSWPMTVGGLKKLLADVPDTAEIWFECFGRYKPIKDAPKLEHIGIDDQDFVQVLSYMQDKDGKRFYLCHHF